MSDTPDRLPPELEAFLAPERRRPDPPDEVQGEVFARLGATLGWFGGPGPGSGPGGSDPSGGGGSPGGGGGAGGLAAHGAKHAAAGAAVKASLAKTIATLVVGGVIGSGVHEAYDRVSERRVSRAQPVAAAAPPVAPRAAPPSAPPAPEPVPEAAAPAATRVASPPPKVEHAARTEIRERDRTLAAERGLIEQARTALGREQAATALAALERHAHDFPQGALEEERESLLVQALVGAERFDQARKTATRFHKRFPRSIFGAVVDEALNSIP